MRKKRIMIERMVALMLTLTFAISPLSTLHAEDYPAGYLGSGYRNYLSDKMQNGYYVAVFSDMEMRQKERVAKRNEIEKLVNTSYQATPQANGGIQAVESLKKYSADNLKAEIAAQRREREGFASVNLASGFNYVPHSDGQIDYFRDGLLARSENERAVDEFGNVTRKNTYNIKYNDKRLMLSYEADLIDVLGNLSHQRWYGATYTSDSVFYGDDETVANKNINEYFLEETDSAGNVKLTHWNALSYEGKLVRAFHQRTEDSVYGKTEFTRSDIKYNANNPKYVGSYHEEGVGTDNLLYVLDRNGIQYNDAEQILSFHEEKTITNLDNTKTKVTTDGQFKYADAPNQFGRDVEPGPDRLLESTITTKTENPDDSFKIETTTNKYEYDASFNIIGAKGHSEINGQEADWWEYTDKEGTLLIRAEENGQTVYFFIDPNTNQKVYIPEDEVIAALKDGNKFSGASDIQYEVLYGEPMIKAIDSQTAYFDPTGAQLIKTVTSHVENENGLKNNLRRLFNSSEQLDTTYAFTDARGSHQYETKNIVTTFEYADNGNLIGATGEGTGRGYESTKYGWKEFDLTDITIDYKVILGLSKQTRYEEEKLYH